MTALDAVGPYEVLARLPEAEVKFVASTPGPRTTDVGLVLTADASLDDVSTPDIIVIPGSGKVLFWRIPRRSSGCAVHTRRRGGQPRSARDRCCSARPASCKASAP